MKKNYVLVLEDLKFLLDGFSFCSDEWCEEHIEDLKAQAASYSIAIQSVLDELQESN